MNTYLLTVTDTFGGEANYAWVTRHRIVAKSELGAIQKLSKRSGIHWRWDGIRYNSASGATCCFIEEYDEYTYDYKLDTDDLA